MREEILGLQTELSKAKEISSATLPSRKSQQLSGNDTNQAVTWCGMSSLVFAQEQSTKTDHDNKNQSQHNSTTLPLPIRHSMTYSSAPSELEVSSVLRRDRTSDERPERSLHLPPDGESPRAIQSSGACSRLQENGVVILV